jgi:hypothetical protein
VSGIDRSPPAVTERVRRALAAGRDGVAGKPTKGSRSSGEAVRDRLRQVSQLRRVGLVLDRDRPRGADPVGRGKSSGL